MSAFELGKSGFTGPTGPTGSGTTGATGATGSGVTGPTGAAGGDSMVQLFDSTLGGDAAAIDTGAAGVAQTANHLHIVCVVRTTQAVVESSVVFTFNNDTGANYDRQRILLDNTTVTGLNEFGQTGVNADATGASAEAGAATFIRMEVPCYQQTTFHKVGEQFCQVTDDTAADTRLAFRSFRWNDTAAITRVAVTAGSGNLLAGSRMTIYGLI